MKKLRVNVSLKTPKDEEALLNFTKRIQQAAWNSSGFIKRHSIQKYTLKKLKKKEKLGKHGKLVNIRQTKRKQTKAPKITYRL